MRSFLFCSIVPPCSVAAAMTQAMFPVQSWEAVTCGPWVDGHRFSLSLWQSGTALLSMRSSGHAPQFRRRQHCPLRFESARCPTWLEWCCGAYGPANPTVHHVQALRKHTGTCWWQGADRVPSIPILSLMERLNPKKKAKYWHSSMPRIPLCNQSQNNFPTVVTALSHTRERNVK